MGDTELPKENEIIFTVLSKAGKDAVIFLRCLRQTFQKRLLNNLLLVN